MLKNAVRCDRDSRSRLPRLMLALVVGISVTVVATMISPVSAAAVPEAPVQLKAEWDDEADVVVLSWVSNDPGLVVGFNVERNGDYHDTVMSATEFFDEDVAPGTYRYRVAAFTGEPQDRAYSPYSVEVEFDVVDSALPVEINAGQPTKPRAVAAVVLEGTRIKLDWNEPSSGPATGYNVYRDSSYLETVTDSSFIDETVATGTSYSYQVVAFAGPPQGRQFGPMSDAAPVTIPASETPAPTSNPAPTTPQTVTGLKAERDVGEVGLTWIPPASGEPRGYDIYRNGQYLDSAQTNEFRDRTVSPDTVYQYQIVSVAGPVDASVYSDKSEPISVRTVEGPGALGHLTQLGRDPGLIELVWGVPSVGKVDGYNIYRDGVYATTLNGREKNTWVDATAKPATPYVYTVQAFAGPEESRVYGPKSSLRFDPGGSGATGENGPTSVRELRLNPSTPSGVVFLEWGQPIQGTVAGYRVERDGRVVVELQPDYTNFIESDMDGVFAYSVQAFSGEPDDRSYGPRETIRVSVTGETPATSIEEGLAPVEELEVNQTDYQTELVVNWERGSGGPIPSGYNVDRNGQFLASVLTPHYFDNGVQSGETYTYTITPYLNAEDGSSSYAPKTTSKAITVEATPASITPNVPTDVEVRQLSDTGDIEVSWTAPSGWAQGLIDGYEIHRNGEVVATIDEPDFGSQLGFPTRTYVDTDAPLDSPSAYSVIALSEADDGTLVPGERSPVALIAPHRPTWQEFFEGWEEGFVPSQRDIPQNFIRAVEETLGVSGVEADRLGGEFYTIYLLGKSSRDGYKPLLWQFNLSMAEHGWKALSRDQFVARPGNELAQWLVDEIAGPASGRHILAVIPGYEPEGYAALKDIRDFGTDSYGSVDGQMETVREQTQLLDDALADLDATSSPKRGDYQAVARPASRVVFAASGIGDCVDNERTCATKRLKFYEYMRDGFGSTRPAAFQLFSEASEAERAEFFGIEPAAWEFSRPYQDIDISAQQQISRLRKSKIRRYLASAISFVVSLAIGNLNASVWVNATVAGFGAFTSTFILTGNVSAAVKEGVKRFAEAGLTHYLDLPNKNGLEIAGEGALHALLAKMEDRNPYQAFIGSVANNFLKQEFGEEQWEKISPYLGDLQDVLILQVLNGNIDWEDFEATFQDEIYKRLGSEIGAFIGSRLPTNWGEIGNILGDLAAYAIIVGNNRADLQNFFNTRTLPSLIRASGNSLVQSLGGEEDFFNGLYGDLLEIAALGINANSDAVQDAFEKMVYKQAGQFLESKLRATLISANNDRSNKGIEILSEALGIAVTYSYDSAERERRLREYGQSEFVSMLADLVPRCGDDHDAEVNRLSGDLMNTLIAAHSSDAFEANAMDLVQNGILLGQTLSDLCTEQTPPQPEIVEASPEEFRSWLLREQGQTLRARIAVASDGSRRVVTAKNEAKFENLRAIIPKGQNRVSFEQLEEPTSPNRRWKSVAALNVSVELDSSGEIVDFYESDSAPTCADADSQGPAALATAGGSGSRGSVLVPTGRMVAVGSSVDVAIGAPTEASGAPTIESEADQSAICQTIEGFREWLLSDSFRRSQVNVAPAPWDSSQLVVWAKDDFSDYRVVVSGTNGRFQRLVGAGGPNPTFQADGTSPIQAVFLDGEFVRFGDYVHLSGQMSSNGRSLLADLIALANRVADGCGAALTGFVDAIKAAIVEYWQADSLSVYLAEKWADLEIIIEAIAADPVEFVQQFFAEEWEEFQRNEARWIGQTTCELLLATVAGLGSTKFAKLFTPEGKKKLEGIGCRNGNSFPSGTPVLMADGSRVAIDGVRPGDVVLAANPVTGVWSPRSVLDQWSHVDDGVMATVTLVDGSRVTATDHHEFWVDSDGAWLELEDVDSGDFLLTPEGVVEVASVELTGPRSTLVWELDIAVDDSFAVFTGSADVLVHNASRCNPAGALSDADRQAIDAGSELKELDAADPAVLGQALASYQTRRITGPDSTQFLVKKDDISRMLRRHHPRFWDRHEVKTQNTSFDGSLSPDQVVDMIEVVIAEGVRIEQPDGFSITGNIDGLDYEVFLNTREGLVDHFTPLAE